jgi:hypothetical protein
MLPVDFLGPSKSNPHDANYHLWTASGDADVDGSAGCNLCQTFHLHDRATHFRQSTVVQGTGHAWFHDAGGTTWFTGPCPIYEAGTHLVQLGHFLPLIKHYIEGNIPGKDFLVRQYEHFHPPSVPADTNPCYVVTHEYRNGPLDDDGVVVIDDYQSETSLSFSSSGCPVTYDVTGIVEGRLDDNNSSFTWTTSDPFNGATQAGPSDLSRGVVFTYDGDKFYEWEVCPAERDFTDNLYVSFRGAQGTQHPFTLNPLGDQTFALTLRDEDGVSSTINIGAYGGGLEQPYQRSGGWHNEMERIRIRITDFLTNGSGIDLSRVEAIRLDLGPSFGTVHGRIVIDECMLDNDLPPFFINLALFLLSDTPEFIAPYTPTTFQVQIDVGSDDLVEGSPMMHYSLDGGDTWVDTALTPVAADIWEGTLPALECTDVPQYYFSAAGETTGPVYVPAGGAAEPFTAFVGVFNSVLDDDFENDLGWTVESDPSLTGGEWERGVPAGDFTDGDPTEDYDGSGQCFLTENAPGNSDVDWGPTWMISPEFDMSALSNPVLRLAYWWSNDDQDGDPMYIEVGTYDDIAGEYTWTLVDTIANIPPEEWFTGAYFLADYATLTDQTKVRISAQDVPNDSKNEGAIDAVEIFDVTCE